MTIPTRLSNSIRGLNQLIDYIDNIVFVKDLTILEIGSWAGTSSIEFAKRFKEVVCVDPWEATEGINTKYKMSEVEKLFDQNTKPFNNIIKIKRKAEDYIKETIKMYDIVYIDGIHTYDAVKRDIKDWLPKTRLFISGHDFYNKFPGVMKAVNERLGKPDKIFPDTSWIKAV